MSSTFPLPQECLEAIIVALAQIHSLSTVATLLRVNKYVCSVVLPILYNGLVSNVILNDYNTKDSSDFWRRQKLIVMLLQGVPKTHITDLLRAAFLPDSFDGQGCFSASFVPYHVFATRVSLHSRNDIYEGDFRQDHNPPPRKLVDFVKEHGLKDRYVAETPLAYIIDGSPWETVTKSLNRELRRDLTWAFCSDVEHIRYVTIPISDIDRYLPLAGHFKTLSHVYFLLDRQMSGIYSEGPGMLNAEELVVLNKLQDERTRHLNQMVLFVQSLRQYHNVLQAAACIPAFSLRENCPKEYEEKLARLLPPLPDLQEVYTANWMRFAIKVKETNLSAIRTIMPPPEQQGAFGMPQLLKQSPFLHRCRSLVKIHLTSFSDDIFQWAIDERRQYDADIAAGHSPQQSLVPLQIIEVVNKRPTDGRLINDIGFAFGKTLRNISVHAHSVPRDDNMVLTNCFVGGNPSWSCSWRAPQLCNLNIHTDYNLIHIHPGLLAHCPELLSVNLSDRCQEYSTSDIIRWEPAELYQIKSLSLRGSPALSFHPDTLRNTPELQHLSLTPKTVSTGTSYIPPVAELEELEELEDVSDGSSFTGAATTPSPRRIIWTWDWNLPILSSLTFTGELAYRFQFKMLRGTPSLERFRVELWSATGRHNRTVGVKDLFLNPQDSMAIKDIQDDEEAATQLEYIHLPKLRDFIFKGDWTFDKRVLTILCSKLAPNMQNLAIKGCGGFGLNDLYSTVLSLPRLQRVQATFEENREWASEVGLIHVRSHQDTHGEACYRTEQPVKRWTGDRGIFFYFIN